MGNDAPEYHEPGAPGELRTDTPIATLYESWLASMKVAPDSPEARAWRPAFLAGALAMGAEAGRRHEAFVMFLAIAMNELRHANVDGMATAIEDLDAIGRRVEAAMDQRP